MNPVAVILIIAILVCVILAIRKDWREKHPKPPKSLKKVQEELTQEYLFANKPFLGENMTGIGISSDRDGPFLLINMEKWPTREVPETIKGVRIKIEVTGPIVPL